MRSLIIRLFILFGLLFPALASATVANFAGSYSGTFSGGDSGTWTATISSTGAITAAGVSSLDGPFTASGQVSPDSSLTMSTGGATSSGATLLLAQSANATRVTGSFGTGPKPVGFYQQSGTFTCDFASGESGPCTGSIAIEERDENCTNVMQFNGTMVVIGLDLSRTGPIQGTTTITMLDYRITTNPDGSCTYVAGPMLSWDNPFTGTWNGTTGTTVSPPSMDSHGNPINSTGSFKVDRNPPPPVFSMVVTSGSGNGAVTSSPSGINCGSTCSASFTSGTVVTLTATPADNNTYFYGWSGACSGTGSCVVTMNAAKDVTATFKSTPFVATTTSIITPTSATISTTVSFDPADVGKTGAVYITAWAPTSGLTALGILAAPTNHALSVTTTRDNPYTGGAINTRQETLAAVLAAADPNAFVLVQLTSSGWQLVQNGQLIPYASGVLGDSMSALSILNNANPSNLLGAQFCVGYGTSAAEMVASGRMMPVADIPGSTVATNGSCNVAANPYKGLWWNPAENGWGMSVTQHDSINFVAMYTYDQSAQPIWYVMSSCPIVAAGSCTGDIYKVTGGKPPTAAWVALDFAQALSTAGSGTLTFSDTNNAKFDFTLNGVAGSKNIERQLFSSGTSAQAVDYSDLWWNANESGWGVALTQDVGMIFATWYTYDAAGLPVWYVASSCPLSGSGCTGNVYKVTGGMPLSASWVNLDFTKALSTVGTVTFAFSDSSTGTMSYTIDGVAGSRAIVRQAF